MKRLSTWRRVALTAWDAPRNPTAHGMLDIDVENALEYLSELEKRSGVRVSLTHLVGKAFTMGMADVPETNAYVSRGRLIARKTIDAFFQVSFSDRDAADEIPGEKPADLGGVKVVETNEKPLVQIAREVRERATRIREGNDLETKNNARSLARMPASFIGTAIRVGGFLSYDLGLDLSVIGIPFDAYGSVMITNVGVFGLPSAIAPLSELSRVPIVVTIGALRTAPGVFEGVVVPRKQVTVGVAFDHRVMDGSHAGRIAKRFLAVLADPERTLGY